MTLHNSEGPEHNDVIHRIGVGTRFPNEIVTNLVAFICNAAASIASLSTNRNLAMDVKHAYLPYKRLAHFLIET